MKKIKGINEQKIESEGFVKTEYGYSKVIPNTFRFCYTLYIKSDDIYGTVTGMRSGGDTLDYEAWLKRMSFRSPEIAERVKKNVENLVESGVITIEDI